MRFGKSTIYFLAVLIAVITVIKPGGGERVDVIQTEALSGLFEVHFIDVGQADSILCVLPEGGAMLVDAGNNDDGELVSSYISKQGIDKIDYLVGTHPHEDHIGGMDTIINDFEIGEIYMPKAAANTRTFEDVLDAVSEKNMRINTARQGVTVFETEEASARILSPIGDNYEEKNEYSAVIMLQYGQTRFLLTGDMERVNEFEIEEDVSAQVLKVPHHGSDSSSTRQFLERVAPEVAVISVGTDNSYGHPHEEVLRRLEKNGAKILRTDQSGTIVVYSDGKEISY